MSEKDYMRPLDIEIFKKAAHVYQVWILLRESNPAAKQYIGVKGFVPKRIDCKAKTADYDVTLPDKLGFKRTAGLVVDPTIKGMMAAFKDPEGVEKCWNGFKSLCYFPVPGKETMYFPGKLYSVQMDPASEYYGCVLFSSMSLRPGASYIHSDYDLYGIVSADDPATNEFVQETRHDQEHSRSRHFFDVQHYLNNRMAVPMILHGEQETFMEDFDDSLTVFCPDGQTILDVRGEHAIRKLYSETFKGRQVYGPNATLLPSSGRWVKAGAKA